MARAPQPVPTTDPQPADLYDPQPSTTEPPVERQSVAARVLLSVFVIVPFAAVPAAIPVAWGWGLAWRDVIIAVAMF